MAVLFFSEGTDFKLAKPRIVTTWIKAAIKEEGRTLDSLSYIFCTDSYLASLNQKFLKHNTLTDIITFNYSNDPKRIHGEVYISVDRVKENAAKFRESFERELSRVLIHGVLHLVGYNDKTAPQKALMRKKEEAYLSLL